MYRQLALALFVLASPSVAFSQSPANSLYYHAEGLYCGECEGSGTLLCPGCRGIDLTTLPCKNCKGVDLTSLPCGHCKGDKRKADCGVCGGKDQTQMLCPFCKGTGGKAIKRCAYCGGSGHKPPCSFCNGSGKTTCHYCSGTGNGKPCSDCRGSGKQSPCSQCQGNATSKPCSTCLGTGYVEKIVSSKPTPDVTTAEDGSKFNDADSNGAKIVFVLGYYRLDGEYVPSHFRSLSNDKSSRGPPLLHDKPQEVAPVAAKSPATVPAAPEAADNGSQYGEISPTTGNPKTVHVKGYYRNGKWVKGHYRSKPRR